MASEKGKKRMELKFAERRRINFALLVFLNLLATALLVTGFSHYIKKIDKDQQNRNILAVENTTDTLTETFGSYLVNQSMVTNSFAEYIDEGCKSVDEAMNYLFVWKDFYKAIAMIDVNTYHGWALAPGTTDKISDYNYEDYRWARNAIAKVKSNEDEALKITDVFNDADGVSHDMAFYAPVWIEDKQYVVFFIFDTETLRDAGMNVKGLEQVNGLLLDKNGNIIIGDLAGIRNAVGLNFFEFFDSRDGLLKSEDIKKEVKEKGKYTYRVKDKSDSGAEYICVARMVPNTDGWIYIYNTSTKEFGLQSELYGMANIFVLTLIIWVGLVLLFFVLYNRVIRGSFEIIEKQNEDLEYASQAKSTFVSNVSHELRTPINAVLGMNEMILKETTEENIRDYAYDIGSAGRTLLSVINDVLDFSKIESGKMEIVDSEYSLVSTVKDVYTLIQLKAEAKELDFIINMSQDIPKTLIGDDVRIKQVLTNLLTNAVKYTDKGTVTLRIDCKKKDDKTTLVVTVDDTGIGMKKEEMDKLFEEYGRLDMKKNHKTEGTGLGLPIVRRILELMESELKVESEYGVGSKFYFELDQKVADWTPVGGINLLEKTDSRSTSENSEKVKEITGKILAVDDTALNIKVLKALLKDTKLEIDSCDGGLRALKMCDSVKYDLIFLDHRMPGMDGIETLHRLQESSIMNKETPVIALTANVVSGARESYIAEGFVDFLSKPINIAELNKVIEKYLN